MPKQEEEIEVEKGPINIREAHNYTEQLGAIFDKFDSSICNGYEDAIPKMLQEVKTHVARTWDQTKTTDTRIVTASVAEPTCDML